MNKARRTSSIDISVIEYLPNLNTDTPQHANFEKAILAAKFGKFNVFLFILSIPAGWSSVFETTTMSYVFPVAQCDLNLSLSAKGSLNAITFLGMVTSGFAWGFLCDTLGRKKLMVIGYLLDSCFVIMSSFSQNFTVLIISKFLGGFIINGPFAALTAYLSEFHCSKHRTKVQMTRGIIISCGTMMLPFLAWVILPLKIDLHLFNNRIVLHSWNIYILVCAIPSLLSGIIFVFMPESPKFLMTTGRNQEALEVFQMVYKLNTGKPKDSYPIKQLIDETKLEENTKGNNQSRITANRSNLQALREGFQQVKPICFPPHVKNILLVCLIQSMFQISINSIRLWLPQIFQSISDYTFYNNGTTSNLCTMLETTNSAPYLKMLNNANSSDPGSESECFVNLSSEVYINTIIISTVQVMNYLLVATFIDKLGRKLVLSVASTCAGMFVMSLYFAQNNLTTLALASLFLSFGNICGNVMISIVIDLFPTSLRTVSISFLMMMGRTASIVGNLLFPLLLQLGCAPTFFSYGSTVIGASLLTLLLPNTDMKDLI